MDLTALTARLATGEDIHTEFKEQRPHPDDLATEIVALANADGGQIFIGVNDDGQIVGVEDPNSLMRSIDNIAYNNCEPPVTVVQETIQNQEQRIVCVIHVAKGAQRPHRTNRGVYYIRTSSGRRQASREELLRLFQATESLYYDEAPILSSAKTDIENQTIDDLLKMASQKGFDVETISHEQLLLNWRLLRAVNGGVHLSVAGALFLARTPLQFLPHAYITALRVPGADIANEPLDQKRIEGRLVQMLEDALRFLTIHLPQPHRIQGLEPEARPEIPTVVLREVLVNALSHRDYTIAAPIRLIVFDDRLEFWTPGQLPNTVTLESLRYGIHVLRNPIIYSTFLRIGLVTDAGSGIPRIIRLTHQATNREPEFRLASNQFVLTLPRVQGNSIDSSNEVI